MDTNDTQPPTLLSTFEYSTLDPETRDNYVWNTELEMYQLSPQSGKYLWNIEDLEEVTD